ncbi:unnamed protein product [Menidia menidia]|uniref:(Atlantic silverside) hypothetical protein n=1 Tax=Menidia menidia TaxID=238744 RepID=A0A8S4ANQ5_9TELE|nr:unnamed protein product [Menidia menidia]
MCFTHQTTDNYADHMLFEKKSGEGRGESRHRGEGRATDLLLTQSRSPPPRGGHFAKKDRIMSLNDYRLVTLTFVVIKSLEKLILSHLKPISDPLLDPLRFGYTANRSVDNAIYLSFHHILMHLDRRSPFFSGL